MDTRRKEILPDNSGIRVKVKIVKNKVSTPFKAVMLDILFGSGIDRLGSMLDAALDLDVVERRGSWYAYKGNNLAQGRQKVVEMLKSNDELATQLETEVRSVLSDVESDLSDAEVSPELSEDALGGAASAGVATDEGAVVEFE